MRPPRQAPSRRVRRWSRLRRRSPGLTRPSAVASRRRPAALAARPVEGRPAQRAAHRPAHRGRALEAVQPRALDVRPGAPPLLLRAREVQRTAKEVKAALVAEAEALAGSTDWGSDIGRLPRPHGALEGGRSGQPQGRRRAVGPFPRRPGHVLRRSGRGEQGDGRRVPGEPRGQAGTLEQAEALLPITDLGAAKAALRDVQAKWEAAGKVPRGDLQRVEGRLRAVEQAVRDADQAHWRRTNPETRARAEGAAAQLHAAIAALEEDLEKARGQRRAPHQGGDAGAGGPAVLAGAGGAGRRRVALITDAVRDASRGVRACSGRCAPPVIRYTS